jgi:DNA mismatch repair protein MutS
MSFLQQYFEYTKEYQDKYGSRAIVLMQCGAFFEVYAKIDEDNNIFGSNIVEYCSITDLKRVNKCPGHIMAGFRDYEIDRYIRKLQDHGITAIVYEEYSTAADGSKLRRLQGIYSPGTYIQEDENQITNNIMCIWIEEKASTFLNKKIFGMTNIDIITGRVSLFEHIVENSHCPTTYDEIERFQSIYNPTEIIIITNMEEKKIDDVISFANIHSKTIHKISYDNNKVAKRCFLQNFQQEIINHFFSLTITQSLFDNHCNSVYAMASLTYILQFVAEHNPYLAEKLKEPVFENHQSRVVLANHSLEQLNIINKNSYGKCSSVLSLLNNNISAIGKRRFKRNLLNPSFDEEFLNNEYKINSYINEQNNMCVNWRKQLYELKDLEKIYRFIIAEKFTPGTIPSLLRNFSYVREIMASIEKDHGILSSYINEPNTQEYCMKIEKFIEDTFQIDICENMQGSLDYNIVFIQSNQDEELDNIINTLNKSNTKLQEIISSYNVILKAKEKSSKNNEFIKLHETEKGKINLHITKRRGTLLKNALTSAKIDEDYKSIELISATTTNMCICNKFIDELCINISNYKKQLQQRQEVVYKNILKTMKNFQQEFECVIHIIGCIDNWQNISYMNTKFSLCCPTIDNNASQSYVSLKELYHPLIQSLQQDELYVSNDLELNNDDGPCGILLYGTNAVGKTSYIKSVGICIIMAQAGLFVPAQSMIYKPYKSIMTRILGNDNIFKGLSTFAVEMIELRVILKMANEYSLILGDELCSGTEIDSAKSIFVSGLQWLYKRKASFLFATHLHEIANYEEIKELSRIHLKHLSVIYDKGRNTLIYDRKLREGPGENMYGLEVCKSLQLPDDFLENAIQLRNKYDSKSAYNNLLNANVSHYNSQKILGICEMCNNNKAIHVHHLQHQSNANTNGFIGQIHKNHLGNLMSLCNDCHHNIHSGNNDEYEKKKTTSGKKILRKKAVKQMEK